jgi:GABA(A) receptor-associated protein
MTSTHKSKFRSENPIEKRKEESSRMMSKYPDRIPVIVERANNSQLSDIDKVKYLVPNDLTLGQFIHVIRKRIKLSSEQAIFVFVNNTIPLCSITMSELYSKHNNDDGFLYVVYNGENTFGTD